MILTREIIKSNGFKDSDYGDCYEKTDKDGTIRIYENNGYVVEVISSEGISQIRTNSVERINVLLSFHKIHNKITIANGSD